MAFASKFRAGAATLREEATDLALLVVACATASKLTAAAAAAVLLLGVVFSTRGGRHARLGWPAVAARLPTLAAVAAAAAALFRLWLDLPWTAVAFAPVWLALECAFRVGWLPVEPRAVAAARRTWAGRVRPFLREVLLGESGIRATPLNRRDWAALSLGVAVTAFAYLWTLFSASPRFVSREAMSRYDMLTDGLLSGQLHFKVEPDPRLLQLANPYAGWQGVPRLHDATLFHGHYYLYFGVSPVALLLGPWRLVTGTFLLDGPAIVVFTFAGFLIGTGLWAAGKRRFFPNLPARWFGFGVLMLGLGNFLFFLIQGEDIYEIPISCAYACLMAALAFVAVAASSEKHSRQAAAVGLASLAWGLAIGARPNYLLSVPAFALVVAALWLRAGWMRGFHSRACRGILLCAAAPLAVIGALLAAYNWARFGSILETGLKYQLAASDIRTIPPAGLANVPSGLRAFLIPSPRYLAYFPFIEMPGDTFGILPWAPFALTCLGFPATLLVPALRRSRLWILAGGAALLATLLNFGSLCLFWGRFARYAIDFLPAATLLGLFVAAVVFEGVRPGIRWLKPVLAAAAAVTLAHSVLLGLRCSPADLRAVALRLDAPVSAAERLFGVREGPIDMELLFPPPFAGRPQPLLAAADGADVLTLLRPDADHVQFGFFHRGSGGPESDPQAIDPGRPHEVQIDLGALYPPPEHSAFARWPSDAIEALRRRVLVRLDGRIVLQASSAFYPNDPLHTFIARNPDPADVSTPAFTGRILRTNRPGLPSPDSLQPRWRGGPARLLVRFPDYVGDHVEPLVSTGRKGAGDVLYVTYLGPNRVRFGHDCIGYGPLETEPVACEPGAEQTIDVDMGSLLPEGRRGLPETRTRLQLRFNGRLLLSAPRPFHPAPPLDTDFGFNVAASTAAATSFTGPEFRVEPLRAFDGPPPPRAGGGPVLLVLKFPVDRTGFREPLLVTGREGASDVVFVSYEDGHRLRIGYCHAGRREILGPPVEVTPYAPHKAIVAIGARLLVTIDGVTALDAAARPYPAAPDAIAVGLDPAGAGCCEQTFTGQIEIAEPAP